MLKTFLLEKNSQSWSTILPSIMLYLNSMVQEHTGVSASEILFGRNNNLPADIAFSSAKPLFDDREGYVKQLKRALADIRQKLAQNLGQEKNQKENPFSIGDKVMITLIPEENHARCFSKWKGPFTVTGIPNKLQITYKEQGIEHLTHISYVKKWCERPLCLAARHARGIPRQRVSRLCVAAKMSC